MSLKQRILIKSVHTQSHCFFLKPHLPYKEGGKARIKAKVKGDSPMKQHVGSWETISGSGCNLTGELDPKLAICKAKQPRRWHRMRFWWSMLKWRNPALLLSAESRDAWMRKSGMAEITIGKLPLIKTHRKSTISQVHTFETMQVIVFSSTTRPMPSWAFLEWLFFQ